MAKLNNFLILIGFKFTWIACIFGEIYSNSYIGLSVGLLYLIFFFYFEENKSRSINIVLIFSITGYIWDSLLSYFNFYVIDADTVFLFLPLWFIVLWPCFCCLFVNVLRFFEKKIFFYSLIGSFIVTLTYYGGLKMGLAKISQYSVFLFIYLFWFFLIFFYGKISPKF
tara:strand:- start:115 stop:618 length:504 start_codon:yes stop_codon:yes gene_type:complete